MKTEKLFLLMGRCMSLDDFPETREEIMNELAGSAKQMKALFEMGNQNTLIPALYSVLQRHDLLRLLPEGFVVMLEHVYMQNLEKNRKIIRQVIEIDRFLSEEGTKPLFLKGASYLLQGLYKDEGDRTMADIDILLKEEDIHKSEIIMMANGYLHPDPVSEGDYSMHRHLPPFFHPGKAVPVEIHRYPLPAKYSRYLSAEEVFAESRIMQETEAKVMSLRHQQVLQFFHEAHHCRGKFSSLGTLRGMYDFYLLSKLREPTKNDIHRFWAGKKYLWYQKAVNEVFGRSGYDPQNKSVNISWYLKTELFLMDHLWIDRFYSILIYRPAEILKMATKGLFSSYFRRVIIKKFRKMFKRAEFNKSD